MVVSVVGLTYVGKQVRNKLVFGNQADHEGFKRSKSCLWQQGGLADIPFSLCDLFSIYQKYLPENEEYPRAIEYLLDHENRAHACNENVFVLKYILGHTCWQHQKANVRVFMKPDKTWNWQLKAG